jgi:hypothetical protein
VNKLHTQTLQLGFEKTKPLDNCIGCKIRISDFATRNLGHAGATVGDWHCSNKIIQAPDGHVVRKDQ